MRPFDFSRSTLEPLTLWGRRFLIKRDDKIHRFCNGNKARKFASLLQPKYAGREWISYGGNQSNAMSALAYLAKRQKSTLHYVCPSFAPQIAALGNLKCALRLGAHLHTLPPRSSVKALRQAALELADSHALFIPQGGSVELAEEGMECLARELREQLERFYSENLANPKRELVIFYTSGSGVGVAALSLALRKHLPRARLVVLSCAGSEEELRGQLLPKHAPRILSAPFAFATPRREIWEVREELARAGLLCDLIYDSVGFWLVRDHLEEFRDCELVFIHSGGLLGDISQAPRYAKLFSHS